IQYHGYINVDFADVKTIMSDRGQALMGTGRASGDKRALHAMEQAIASPLLEDVSIDGATGLLINITGGRDMTLQEVNEALTLVHDAADPEAEIIFGSLIDDGVRDEVKITIIATGFQHKAQRQRTPMLDPAHRTPVQVPLIARTPTNPSMPAVHQSEVASLVPAKAAATGARAAPPADLKSISPRTSTLKEPS